MDTWQWEQFEDFINEKKFSIYESSDLSLPVKNFRIKRDEHLKIIIETVCEQGVVKKPLHHYPVGTVYLSEGTIEFRSLSGNSSAIASGVELKNQLQCLESGEMTLDEVASIHKIQFQIKEKSQGKYLIEWLVNVDDNYYIWPDVIKDEENIIYERTLKLGQNFLVLNTKKRNKNFWRNCISFSVDDINLCLGICKEVAIDKKNMPGFIFYEGNPSEEIREKIRLCASFVLGRPFVYLGHTVINAAFNVVSCEAISPYIMDGKIFKYPSIPPSPLHDRSRNMIDTKIFSSIINAVYNKHSELNFKHISWRYWHAIFSPYHISAVHFGAIIESIKKTFIKANKSYVNISLIQDESKWDKIRKSLLNTLSTMDMEEDNLKIMKNNINSLNKVSQKMEIKKFLMALNINLSEMEEDAWLQRHKAAHGDDVSSDGVDIIKKIKVLKILCNRIILSITEASIQYFDYCSINVPIKNIEESAGNF